MMESIRVSLKTLLQGVLLGCSHSDDRSLTHLQGPVIALVHQQVTEPMRIVFVGAFFQVVRTTALLPGQCCQSDRFGNQEQILDSRQRTTVAGRSPRQACAWSASVWMAARAVRNVAVRRTIPTLSHICCRKALRTAL